MINFVTQNNQGGAMHYTLKDRQGNLTATITDSEGRKCMRKVVKE